MMGSGNLDATTPDGITVGQHFCNNIVGDGLSNFGPHKVRMRAASSYSVHVNLVNRCLPLLTNAS